jgi:hypothetical protein
MAQKPLTGCNRSGGYETDLSARHWNIPSVSLERFAYVSRQSRAVVPLRPKLLLRHGQRRSAQLADDQAIASRLARTATRDEIARQINWLPRRNPQRNHLGMLRKAIEEKWVEQATPSKASAHEPRHERDQQNETADIAAESQKRERFSRRETLLAEWQKLSLNRRAALYEQAIDQAPSDTVRRLLLRHQDLSSPTNEVLDIKVREFSTPQL